MSEALETREELPVIDAQIVRYQPAESLAVMREPEQVLADAQKAASALMKVVSGKKKQITFNGETYLESGDWQTVAKFYGVTAKVESTKFVTFGEASGFEAAAVALDCNGREVSRGEAMCLNDEDNWGMRPKYEWQNEFDSNGKMIWEFNEAKGKNLPRRKKVQVGEAPTPLFQLRSMAQTRACGKALSNLFKWVVVLAGYKPTPAEEMIGRIDGEQNSSVPSGYEPDLPSEKIFKPSASPQTKTTAQPPTGQPAAAPAASQSRVGPTKRIPPSPPDNLPGLLCTVKKIEEAPKKGNVNARIRVTLDTALDGSNQGVKWVCQYATCWHEHLLDAVRASVGKELMFAIKESDKKLNNSDEFPTHFLAIEDVWAIDGQLYSEGKPVVEAK
jgi:hypothetical protein